LAKSIKAKDNIRSRIKSTLLTLPFKLGSGLIIPILRFGLHVFVYHRPIIIYRRKRIAKKEARKIRSSIHSEVSRAIIVYDNLTSAPSYGEYIYVILLARYFIANRIQVSFNIVDSEFREDWNVLTKKQIKEFIDEQVTLAEGLLNSNFSQIQRVSWEECKEELSSVSNVTFVPFYTRVRNRISIYRDCFNLLNRLLNKSNNDLRDKILFSFQELAPKVTIQTVRSPYISWQCRYSEKWDFTRNITEDEFIQMYNYLYRRFPDHSILIVSDSVGCAYFTKVADKHNLDVIFSKNLSKTFLGDAALILNSDFFFQVRGGGIGVFPMFSKVPYKIIAQAGHELMWSRKSVTSWQTEQQSFVNKAFFQSYDEAV